MITLKHIKDYVENRKDKKSEICMPPSKRM